MARKAPALSQLKLRIHLIVLAQSIKTLRAAVNESKVRNYSY